MNALDCEMFAQWYTLFDNLHLQEPTVRPTAVQSPQTVPQSIKVGL